MSEFHLNRKISSEKPFDLVVLGGGPAGVASAVQAGRLGLKVLLIESSGCLGGMGTSALVSQWSHISDGKSLIIGGLILEWLHALYENDGLPPGRDPSTWVRHNSGVGFNAETLKRILDQQCLDAGVEIRFFTKLVDADYSSSEHKVFGVIVHGPEGFKHIPAKTFIDATGDAVLVDLVGGQYRQAGRDTPNIMPPTLCAQIAGVDFDRFNRLKDQQNAVEQAIQDGYFSQPDRHVPGLFHTGPTWGILNAGHLFKTDALNTRSLSDGMIRGRKLAEEYTQFYRQYLQGCENAANLGTAHLLGVRESRRIVGENELTYSHYKSRQKFHDQIGVYCKQVDIHVYDCSDEEYQRYQNEFEKDDMLEVGESYGIPYGIIVPKDWHNLWAAGRCCSSDLKVNGAIRDQPACAMMGQAAGAAAWQQVHFNEPAHSLNTETLVTTLRNHGAFLPQEDLSPLMNKSSL